LLIAFVCHAAEFEREKRYALIARTLLAKKDRATLPPYQDGDSGQHR
jgi:hypothetical protein